MQAANVIQLYELGQRGRPIRLIAPGDLNDPYDNKPSLWKRVKSGFANFADALREARELEAQMLGQGRFRGFRED